MVEPKTPCPLEVEIQAFMDGWLDQERRRRFVTHLAACERCRAELDAFQKIDSLLREAAAAPVPAWDRSGALRRLSGARPARLRRVLGFASIAAAASTLAVALWILSPENPHGGPPVEPRVPPFEEKTAIAPPRRTTRSW